MSAPALPAFTEVYRRDDERRGWPAGPWDAEPDKVVWKDAATGLDAMAVRNGVGAWCGYVGLPASHPFHGLDYDQHFDQPCADNDAPADEYRYCYDHSPNGVVSVHGGLTFADACMEGGDPARTICHLSDDGPVWWFGFDTAHLGDTSPGMMRAGFDGYGRDETYKDLPWIVAEVARLAEQLSAVAS